MDADPRSVVERLFVAIEAGDPEPILACLSEDAVVTYPADGRLPYGGSWTGHEEIGRFLYGLCCP